jgi:acetyl esterase/lipase
LSRTAAFLREFLRPRPGRVVVEETTYRRDGETLPATLYRPRSARRPLPGWVTLHGLTYQGREHESLQRLARSIAASGAVVLVPDLPEWRALRVAPERTVRTIRSAVLALDSLGHTEPGRVGVMGFSFGATQALIAATDPELEGHLAGVVAWGGYADIGSATRFAFLGEHDLDGRAYRAEPDPYGRWILAGNYLGLLDEFAAAPALPASLLGLALEAGRRRVMSWDPALDPAKAAARQHLGGREREIFDLIAPATGVALTTPERHRLAALVDRMLVAALEAEPLLDPGPFLGRVPVRVFLAHGRGDRLIPWTEMVRLARALPPHQLRSTGITALFAHSTGERRVLSPRTALEAVRFGVLMRRMVRFI